MKKIVELTPTNGRKSFNGKCKVIETKGKIELLSYSTVVAEYDKYLEEYKENGKYGRTTNIHIQHFKNYIGL